MTRPAHLHRAPQTRSRAQAQSRIWHAVATCGPSPEAQRLDALLVDLERRAAYLDEVTRRAGEIQRGRPSVPRIGRRHV